MKRPRVNAFTILEVLMALAASLLLLVGLTRAFKLIGDRITSSQSELEMAGSLRESTYRLRDELRRMTAPMKSPLAANSNQGYFTYYEGPWTDATTSIVHGFSPPPTSGMLEYIPTSRIGDLDDYVAFTTRSEPGKPFSGVVPSGVIEAVRLRKWLVDGNSAGNFRTLQQTPLSAYTNAEATTPAQIFSEFAEVAYFISPSWIRDPLGKPAYSSPTSLVPMQRDTEVEYGSALADGISDKYQLHRRVLLIRDDLNMTVEDMLTATGNFPGGGPYQVPSQPNASYVPFLMQSGSTVKIIPLSGYTDSGHQYYSPSAWSSNWYEGLSKPLQWMDLSISPIVDAASGSENVPTQFYSANSLSSLQNPQNRFGFVRIPRALLSHPPNPPAPNPAPVSSMPILALSPPHSIITTFEAAGDFSSTTSTTPPYPEAYKATAGQSTGTFSSPLLPMVGFLRPEYILADHVLPPTGSAGADERPTFRGGSDIIATDVVGFDIQILDEAAPVAFWLGASPDNLPGASGIDDDFNTVVDDASEAGMPTTNPAERDVLIEPSQIGFRRALRGYLLGPPNEFLIVQRGAYVDYGYARLAGGTIGGINTSRVPTSLRSLINTSFSGLDKTSPTDFPQEWRDQGRLIIQPNSTGSPACFAQPIIDTWIDRFDYVATRYPDPASGNLNVSFLGSPPSNTIYSFDLSNSTTSGTGLSNRFVNSSTLNRAESPSKGMPKAIKITLRVFDRLAGEVRQQTIIEEFSGN